MLTKPCILSSGLKVAMADSPAADPEKGLQNVKRTSGWYLAPEKGLQTLHVELYSQILF